jgi:prepilin-type N-terminal cleavage/methylation domain-containing protein
MKNNRAAQYRPQDNRPSSLVPRPSSGFTLTELLMALMIGAIVMAAAATMAEAMSCGKRETENMTRTANYLAQLNTRLADLIMRAEDIKNYSEGAKVGVTVSAAEGTFDIYTDTAQNILYIHKQGDETPYEYIYKKEEQFEPAQTNVAVKIDDNNVNRVVITFDIEGVSYTMTATRRGGT